jgi:hypothetical protein
MVIVGLYAFVPMFVSHCAQMLASMSAIDLPADAPLLTWNEQSVGELPTGTVTLLLADVEGSTRLWETQSDSMTTALEQLNRAVDDLVAAHNGVRPVEQGEGDSFVVAFARASDAVACALQLQLAELSPIRIRIGCTPGKSSCATPAITRGPPSTGPRDCATWRTAGRPCCPGQPSN